MTETMTTVVVPQPGTATCATCSRIFTPPLLAPAWGGDLTKWKGDATTCPTCAAERVEAERRRGIDAYTAINTEGVYYA